MPPTGEDITRLILAQIVLEDAKTPDSVFPLDVLRQMIVASGKATQDNALRYMKFMMDIYQNAYRALALANEPVRDDGWSLGPTSGQQRRRRHRAPRRRERLQPPRARRATGQGYGTARHAKMSVELKQRIEELEAALLRGEAQRENPTNEISPQILTHCGKGASLLDAPITRRT